MRIEPPASTTSVDRTPRFLRPSPTGRRVGDEGLARKKEPNPPLSMGRFLIRWDQVLCYLAQNILRIIEDLIVTESQHAETLAKHVRIANLVVLPLPVRVVGRAITFHYQTGFAAVEVGDITPELMLAPEFEALQLSIAK